MDAESLARFDAHQNERVMAIMILRPLPVANLVEENSLRRPKTLKVKTLWVSTEKRAARKPGVQKVNWLTTNNVE